MEGRIRPQGRLLSSPVLDQVTLLYLMAQKSKELNYQLNYKQISIEHNILNRPIRYVERAFEK